MICTLGLSGGIRLALFFGDTMQEINVNELWTNNKKQHTYRVLAIALHSEDQSKMVVYQEADPQKPEIWVRPYDLFLAKFTKYKKPF